MGFAHFRKGKIMKVKLIGKFQEKYVDSRDDYQMTIYILKNTILKEDFDNGEIKGIKYEDSVFFGNFYDIQNFEIFGECYEGEKEEYTPEQKQQFEFLDSLEEGDVIIFETDLDIEYYHGTYTFCKLISDITNFKKYDDKYAADELDLLVKEKEDE